MISSDLKVFTRTYEATDDGFLSTARGYGATASQLTLATDAGTATFQASDGLFAHNITLTATVDHSGRTFSVVGVRMDGVTVTEAITGPNGSTVSGSVLFKSISEINTTGVGATDSMAVGIGHKFGLPPTRIKGFRVVMGTDDGTITLKNGIGSTTGTFVAKLHTEAAATGTPYIESESLPGNGIRFEDGAEIALTSGVRSVTIFHA